MLGYQDFLKTTLQHSNICTFKNNSLSLAGIAQWIQSGFQTKGSLVQFPVRAHALVASQDPSGRHARGTHTLMVLFPPPLPSLWKQINKIFFKKEQLGNFYWAHQWMYSLSAQEWLTGSSVFFSFCPGYVCRRWTSICCLRHRLSWIQREPPTRRAQEDVPSIGALELTFWGWWTSLPPSLP